ncbi:hypothetical protein ACFYP6_38530 [Streptomyces goshikiensis]|uniref:hypothetical protein n=1 Tax=Streptomyces goshikiensis TaxID=1942 RepID=UPI0036BCB617
MLHLRQRPGRVALRVGAAVGDIDTAIAKEELQQRDWIPAKARSQAALSGGRIARAGSRSIPSVAAAWTNWWLL